MTTMQKPYYSREILPPKDMREGLQNFVQMIINKAEVGDSREAMLTAVDLLNDLWSGTYDSAFGISKDMAKSNLFTEIAKERDIAKIKAIEEYHRGFKEGQEAKIVQLKSVLNI